MHNDEYEKIGELAEGALGSYDSVSKQLLEFFGLLRQWNDRVRLVSHQDLKCLDEHVLDSLSLAPYLSREGEGVARVLDIGSGGGFPGIPLAIACTELEFVLLERSERKVVFLERAVDQLGLSHVEVRCGSFPDVGMGTEFDFVTARAVERPEGLVEGLFSIISGGARLLCQSERLLAGLEGSFASNMVDDELDQAGFRRGRLYLVEAQQS